MDCTTSVREAFKNIACETMCAMIHSHVSCNWVSCYELNQEKKSWGKIIFYLFKNMWWNKDVTMIGSVE